MKESTDFSIKVANSSNDDAAKIKKEIASVNMMEVLLLRLRWPSMLDSITFISFLSLRQQVLRVVHKSSYSKNGKSRTHIRESPSMIRTRSKFRTVETRLRLSWINP